MIRQKTAKHIFHRANGLFFSAALVTSTALIANTATADESDTQSRFHELEHLFENANIVAGPSLVDCTLSGGTETQCFSISVKAEPTGYTPGPWCPENISDNAEAGGIWLDNGEVHDVDGTFISNLSTFYNDEKWQLFDEDTGKINVTDTRESCDAAARPNVDPAYQNHCVQCLPEYMEEDATVSYIIPLTPVALTEGTGNTRESGSGVAFNGIRLDGPAPLDDILGAYTIAPFDDCGGHVNLHVGYHYHVATDCLHRRGQTNEHGTVVGLAMDGHAIYSRLNAAGEQHTDLDACGGHAVNDEYHYHAGEPGSNAILSCFIAEVGCVNESSDTSCDASANSRSGGGRPDFAAVAKKVGVSESALMQALGGPPPDIEAAAKALNIDANVLREAMPKR